MSTDVAALSQAHRAANDAAVFATDWQALIAAFFPAHETAVFAAYGATQCQSHNQPTHSSAGESHAGTHVPADSRSVRAADERSIVTTFSSAQWAADRTTSGQANVAAFGAAQQPAVYTAIFATDR